MKTKNVRRYEALLRQLTGWFAKYGTWDNFPKNRQTIFSNTFPKLSISDQQDLKTRFPIP